MFYVYLLQSQKDNSYYIGQTENTENRLTRHNSGFVPSTKRKLPWNLIGFEQYSTREEARWREYNLKNNGFEKKQFIEKLTGLSPAQLA